MFYKVINAFKKFYWRYSPTQALTWERKLSLVLAWASLFTGIFFIVLHTNNVAREYEYSQYFFSALFLIGMLLPTKEENSHIDETNLNKKLKAAGMKTLSIKDLPTWPVKWDGAIIAVRYHPEHDYETVILKNDEWAPCDIAITSCIFNPPVSEEVFKTLPKL
jgi:hypothetical protein